MGVVVLKGIVEETAVAVAVENSADAVVAERVIFVEVELVP